MYLKRYLSHCFYNIIRLAYFLIHSFIQQIFIKPYYMQKQFSVNEERTNFKKLKLWCGRSTHDPMQKTWCIQGREVGAPDSHLGCFYFLSGLSRVISSIPRTAFTSSIVTILCPASTSIPNLWPICVTTPGALHSASHAALSLEPRVSITAARGDHGRDITPLSPFYYPYPLHRNDIFYSYSNMYSFTTTLIQILF